jgi:hypothetical protein
MVGAEHYECHQSDLLQGILYILYGPAAGLAEGYIGRQVREWLSRMRVRQHESKEMMRSRKQNMLQLVSQKKAR